jgi:hydrogenase nickel incorporation protein HypA/HybF
MHESSLIAGLMEKIAAIAREHGASRIAAVEITIGALAFIGPEHLREHFVLAAAGTLAEGAELRIRVSDDPQDPDAGSIRLEAVEIET